MKKSKMIKIIQDDDSVVNVYKSHMLLITGQSPACHALQVYINQRAQKNLQFRYKGL